MILFGPPGAGACMVNIFVASDLLLMAEDMLDVSFRIQGECISGITMDACRSIVYTNVCVTMRRCVHVCICVHVYSHLHHQ